jgi:Dehydrogenase E1 component
MAETTAWENPLMPNLRLRQIYLAMMQARTLARALPPRQRGTLGIEACLVSPTVDLGPADLVSDVLAGPVVDFLRGLPATGAMKRKLAVKCGQAAKLPGSADSRERIWTAIGAAAALQSFAVRHTSHDAAATQPGVAVVYLLPRELQPAFLKKMLTLARDKRLPLIFVMLPGATASTGAAAGRLSELAISCGVPAIPTDAADAVAIYRVAQESIGHARIGGGPALLECVPVVAAAKRTKPDAIAGLEQYMLPRKVVTQAWLDRETRSFAIRLPAFLSGERLSAKALRPF